MWSAEANPSMLESHMIHFLETSVDDNPVQQTREMRLQGKQCNVQSSRSVAGGSSRVITSETVNENARRISATWHLKKKQFLQLITLQFAIEIFVCNKCTVNKHLGWVHYVSSPLLDTHQVQLETYTLYKHSFSQWRYRYRFSTIYRRIGLWGAHRY